VGSNFAKNCDVKNYVTFSPAEMFVYDWESGKTFRNPFFLNNYSGEVKFKHAKKKIPSFQTLNPPANVRNFQTDPLLNMLFPSSCASQNHKGNNTRNSILFVQQMHNTCKQSAS
jgi:hypothetical protein